jgi:hypothetical protein
MNESFKLATVSSAGSRPFVSLVLDGTSVGLEAASAKAGVHLPCDTMMTLLEDWDAGFDRLVKVAAYVRRAFVLDCRNLRLTLKVNGEIRKDGNTKDMTFSPEQQIEHVAHHVTLQPGDIFSTGTPEGIAMLTGARHLGVGDVMETEIEGLGVPRNKLVAEGN